MYTTHLFRYIFLWFTLVFKFNCVCAFLLLFHTDNHTFGVHAPKNFDRLLNFFFSVYSLFFVVVVVRAYSSALIYGVGVTSHTIHFTKNKSKKKHSHTVPYDTRLNYCRVVSKSKMRAMSIYIYINLKRISFFSENETITRLSCTAYDSQLTFLFLEKYSRTHMFRLWRVFALECVRVTYGDGERE